MIALGASLCMTAAAQAQPPHRMSASEAAKIQADRLAAEYRLTDCQYGKVFRLYRKIERIKRNADFGRGPEHHRGPAHIHRRGPAQIRHHDPAHMHHIGPAHDHRPGPAPAPKPKHKHDRKNGRHIHITVHK